MAKELWEGMHVVQPTVWPEVPSGSMGLLLGLPHFIFTGTGTTRAWTDNLQLSASAVVVSVNIEQAEIEQADIA